MDKSKKIIIISSVISAVLILACVALFLIFMFKDKNNDATIFVNGDNGEQVSEEFSEDASDLPEDSTVIVTDENGETQVVAVTSAQEQASEKTQGKETSGKSNKKVSLSAGLTSNDISEVLAYYKLAAANNSSLKMKKKLTLISMDVGKVTVDETTDYTSKAETFFTPISKLALALESKTVNLQGTPEKIKESDWVSASAVNDGTYTTLNIKVKEQTDGVNGTEYGGPVGRSMRVLPGFAAAIERIDGVTIDYSTSKIEIKYLEPTITVKVENATGKFVKGECRWHYITNPVLEVLNGTMKVTKLHTVHLDGSSGYVDYEISY